MSCDWCDGNHPSLTLVQWFHEDVGSSRDGLCKCCTDDTLRQFAGPDVKLLGTLYDAKLCAPNRI